MLEEEDGSITAKEIEFIRELFNKLQNLFCWEILFIALRLWFFILLLHYQFHCPPDAILRQ